ncbi:hypothetical protein VTK56DRAFT_4306 [Thermocarpiscus australiensis]
MRDSLRLRLVVRRHALPEVRIVFALRLDNDPTIANLLEQVNDVIPLESTDWGLEDYVVELHDFDGHAFDCLHFQQVSEILRNDEQVFIRPLVTNDRRKRRLSGRDQISADGKHLIDGVAFGRPRLRAPRERPPVDIPPLKRRRITYEAELEDSEDEEPQLRLTEHGEEKEHVGSPVRASARFRDTHGDGFEGDGEYEDEDFVGEDVAGETDDEEMDDLSNSEMRDELRDLQAENERLQDGAHEESRLPDKAGQPSQLEGSTGLDLAMLDKITALRTAFPTVPVDVCERTLLRHNKSLERAYHGLRKRHNPTMTFGTLLAYGDPTRSNQAAAAGDEDFDDSEAESVSSTVKHYDQHGFPSGSILSGTASTHMAETMRRSGHAVKLPVHTKFDDDRPNGSRDGDDREGAADGGRGRSSSSADDSESDNDSDSGPEVASSKMAKATANAALSDSEQSSVSSNNDSDSDSDNESSSSDDDSDNGSYDSSDSSDASDSTDDDSDESSDEDGGSRVHDALESSASSSLSDEADSSSDEDSSDADISSDSASSPQRSFRRPAEAIPASANHSTKLAPPLQEGSVQPPGQEARPHEPLSASPETPKPVPPGQGRTATQKRNARRRAALKAKKAAALAPSWPEFAADHGVLQRRGSPDSGEAMIAAKKAALLQSLDLSEEVPSELADHPVSPSASVANDDTPGASSFRGGEPAGAEPASASLQRKPKLDVGAGRRMLFNALGLKNPKTKADEERLRSSHMNGVKQLENHRLLGSTNNQRRQFTDEQAQEEDFDSWRDHIIYRAVECCQDGVELSEPPFPFVQRWDPQQQYWSKNKNGRGGASKRKQRNQAEFLDEVSRHNAKRRKYVQDAMEHDADNDRWESDNHQEDGTGYDDTVLNYDDEPEETSRQGETAPRQDGDEDDLPPLPADLSTLPALKPGETKPGMIVTWKQWLLSKATGWQPRVSDLTGIVVDVLDDGALKVRLAKRDRNLDHNEKMYDENGNRVYDKFEVPGMDDDGEESIEQGYRTLELADMIEPLVLRPLPRPSGGLSPARPPLDSKTREPSPDATRCEVAEVSAGGTSATLSQDEAERRQPDSRQMDVGARQSGQSQVSEATLRGSVESQTGQ